MAIDYPVCRACINHCWDLENACVTRNCHQRISNFFTSEIDCTESCFLENNFRIRLPKKGLQK